MLAGWVGGAWERGVSFVFLFFFGRVLRREVDASLPGERKLLEVGLRGC